MSSSSSIPFQSCENGEFEDGNRGIPQYCRCGVRVLQRTSKTTKNPGRLFFCCPKGSENGGFHTFKWTDEAVVEEIEELKGKVSKFETMVVNCETMVECFEKETMEFKAKVSGYDKAMEDMRGEVNCLKKIIVAGIVVFGCLTGSLLS